MMERSAALIQIGGATRVLLAAFAIDQAHRLDTQQAMKLKKCHEGQN
jgi:hypothetical protein